MDTPNGLTNAELRRAEEMKRDFRQWAKGGKPGWHCRRKEAEAEGEVTTEAEQEANVSERQETLGGMSIPPDIARNLRKEIERQKAGGSPYFLVQKVQGYKVWLEGPTLQAVLPDDGRDEA